MQEIIPMIEHTWSSLCLEHGYHYQLIDVDNTSPACNIQTLISSDLIVVTCFNSQISHFVKILRDKLKIDTRFFFYLHGLATIGLWPLQRFGVLPLLTTNDLFIGTCDGDIKSMNLSFVNACSMKIPFTIIDSSTFYQYTTKTIPFVYIGRISPQKNLDQLLCAYSELSDSLKSAHPLYFYGSEDHLGFPNIGLQEHNYLNQLRQLVIKLKLNPFVTFKGFVERLDIQKELGANYIFVSPSTHSDENFGMAAFRSLLTGAPCILTKWGGHKEFATDYQNRIYYLTPTLTDSGPLINLSEFKNALTKAANEFSLSLSTDPINFNLARNIRLFKLELEKSLEHSEPLKPTALALSIFSQQEQFEKNNEKQRCFNSFNDPAFISYFEAYL